MSTDSSPASLNAGRAPVVLIEPTTPSLEVQIIQAENAVLQRDRQVRDSLLTVGTSARDAGSKIGVISGSHRGYRGGRLVPLAQAGSPCRGCCGCAAGQAPRQSCSGTRSGLSMAIAAVVGEVASQQCAGQFGSARCRAVARTIRQRSRLGSQASAGALSLRHRCTTWQWSEARRSAAMAICRGSTVRYRCL